MKILRNFSLLLLLLVSLFTLTLTLTSAAGAKLFLSPETGTHYVGSYFSVEVLVDTGGNKTNAYEAVLAYPPDKLEAVSVSGGGSICDLWITQTKTTLECGATKAYKGTGGRIGTLTFRAKAAGTANISISGGNVKKADGSGTEILSARGSAAFEIQELPEGVPAISSSTHPDQNAWYQENTATLSWTAPSGADGYSYVLSSKPEEIPNDSSEGTATILTYEDLTDGTWYFHLKAKSGSSWSNTNHFRIQIDRQPPEDFEIVVDPPGSPITRAPLLSFAATDALSGVDHYEISINGSEFATTSSPYQFDRIKGGNHEITVRAVDRAGNVKEAKVILNVIGVSAPTIVRPIEGDRIPFLAPLEITATSTAVGKIELVMDGKVFTTLDNSTGPDYTYRKLLSPKEHQLTAVFLNSDGIESEPTAVKFLVNPWAVYLFGLTVPGFVFYPVLLAVLAGLFLLARRWIKKVRVRVKSKSGKPNQPMAEASQPPIDKRD